MLSFVYAVVQCSRLGHVAKHKAKRELHLCSNSNVHAEIFLIILIMFWKLHDMSELPPDGVKQRITQTSFEVVN